ncbi:hypothetical protein BDF19DRAFT_426358 [Syncephalis fuscata]|nr:hypothetical protein BDF19DRAFT_426358 [Syncephalis fuscata]
MAQPIRNRVFTHFISPVGDVVFSVSVGAIAYVLYERDQQRASGCSFRELAGNWASKATGRWRSTIAVHDPEEDEEIRNASLKTKLNKKD